MKDFVESQNDARHVLCGAFTRAAEAREFEVAIHIATKTGLVGYVQQRLAMLWLANENLASL